MARSAKVRRRPCLMSIWLGAGVLVTTSRSFLWLTPARSAPPSAARAALTGTQPMRDAVPAERGVPRAAAAVAQLVRPLSASAAVLAFLGAFFWRTKVWLETPKRPYSAGTDANSVGAAYDDWTRDGVLEHYWGEHIHMGSYTPMSKQTGYSKNDGFLTSLLRGTLFKLKNFKDAKLDFTKEMLAWSGATAPKRILDVGCGIGGSSRHLARTFPDAEVIGITLSPEQVARATALAKEAGLTNCRFQVTNALEMTFPEGSFDLVWGCESGEHMPDKEKYVQEMVRMLAPKGKLVVATWCEREPSPPFTPEERKTLDFMYEEWSHPFFISLEKYKTYLEATEKLSSVEIADWTEQTLPSWRHSIWVGVWRPWYWIKQTLKNPLVFLGFVREIYTLEVYHRSMRRGLMVYGMMRATKS